MCPIHVTLWPHNGYRKRSGIKIPRKKVSDPFPLPLGKFKLIKIHIVNPWKKGLEPTPSPSRPGKTIIPRTPWKNFSRGHMHYLQSSVYMYMDRPDSLLVYDLDLSSERRNHLFSNIKITDLINFIRYKNYSLNEVDPFSTE